MFNVHRHLQDFCTHSHVFKGNTERGVKTLNYELGHFFEHSEISHLADIDRRHIETYVCNGKLKKDWSAKTIRNRIISIRIFLDWCVKEELIRDNPARKIDLPRLPRKLPEHLPYDDAKDLLIWTRNYPFKYWFEGPRAMAIISTFIFAGLRLTEVYDLELRDVRLDEGSLFVRRGKGKKDRYIPICAELEMHLRAYLKARTKLNCQSPYFLFPTNISEKWVKNPLKGWLINCENQAASISMPTCSAIRSPLSCLKGAQILCLSRKCWGMRILEPL